MSNIILGVKIAHIGLKRPCVPYFSKVHSFLEILALREPLTKQLLEASPQKICQYKFFYLSSIAKPREGIWHVYFGQLLCC